MSQINTVMVVYVLDLNKICFKVFLKHKYEGVERTVLGIWFQGNGTA